MRPGTPTWGENGLLDLRADTALRNHVIFVLDYCDGELRWAARELEISESTLTRWLKSWNISYGRARNQEPLLREILGTPRPQVS